MSSEEITVRYDGPILADHQMDVADLAPALIGLSDLCKLANRKFNGDRAAVKVLIATDAEQNCVQFKIAIVQSLWDVAKGLVVNPDVKTAQDICEWIGIIGGSAGGSVVGLIRLLAWLRGRKVDSTKVVNNAGRDVVQITVGGDFIYAHKETFDLMHEKSALTSIKKVFQPIVKEGYDNIQFEDHKNPARTTEKIAREDAEAIVSSTWIQGAEDASNEVQTITAWVKVYSPVFDSKATHWRFTLADTHPYMDITETNIASHSLTRGGSMVDDAYRVKLEIQQTMSPKGQINTTYKIKDVLEFRAAPPEPVQTVIPYEGDGGGGQSG